MVAAAAEICILVAPVLGVLAVAVTAELLLEQQVLQEQQTPEVAAVEVAQVQQLGTQVALE
jgi:hypothetical protein